MEGEWLFVPYESYHDNETGDGYWRTNFEGGRDFVEYEKRYTDSGYYVQHLDGEELFIAYPVEEEVEEEVVFDIDAAE